VPLEIVGDGVSFIFRLIARFFIEIIFEMVIQGTGYLFCRMFHKNVKPDGLFVALVGLILWAALIYAGFEIAEFVAVDTCLDSGGSHDQETGACVT